jgi:hypothetical protein
MRRTISAAAALGAAGLFALPAPANAATARAVGSPLGAGVTPKVSLEYVAAPGERNRLTLAPPPGAGGGEVDLRDPSAVISPGPGCERIDDHAVRCSPRLLVGPTGPAPAGFDEITARLGDGADEARAQSGVEVGLTIEGGPGGDTLAGGDGPDTFVETGESARDDIDGEAGSDTLDYAGRRRAVSVDLSRGRGADGDRVQGIENVAGGRGRDRLTGSARANLLDGQGGDDVLTGRGGRDTLIGGGGRDVLSGGSGEDTLELSAGERRAVADRARCGSRTDVTGPAAAADRLGRDCEWALVEGLQSGGFGVLASQPLRAQRSGVVEVRLSVHRKTPKTFRGRIALRFRGILLGRPSRAITLNPGERTTARVGLVDPALSRLVASRRLRVEVIVNDATFTTTLRAPLRRPGAGGGTPA